jgi:hypothetical protein
MAVTKRYLLPLIATNVKDDPVVFENARLPKLGFDVLWGAPPGFPGFRMPGFQRPFGIGILGYRFPKLPQGPFGYHSHTLDHNPVPFRDQDCCEPRQIEI